MCCLLEKQIAAGVVMLNGINTSLYYLQTFAICAFLVSWNILVICWACDVDMKTLTGLTFFLDVKFSVNPLIER